MFCVTFHEASPQTPVTERESHFLNSCFANLKHRNVGLFPVLSSCYVLDRFTELCAVSLCSKIINLIESK